MYLFLKLVLCIKEIDQEKETLVEYGFRLPSAMDNEPLKFDEWELLTPQRVYVSATPSRYETERQDNLVELIIRPTGLTDPDVGNPKGQPQLKSMM